MGCCTGCAGAETGATAAPTGSKRQTRTSVYHFPLNSRDEISICALMVCPGANFCISSIWFVQQVKQTVRGYCSSVSMIRSCLRHGPRALVPSVRLPSLTTFPIISIELLFNDLKFKYLKFKIPRNQPGILNCKGNHHFGFDKRKTDGNGKFLHSFPFCSF